jgi:hypothetical protein
MGVLCWLEFEWNLPFTFSCLGSRLLALSEENDIQRLITCNSTEA